MSPKKQSSPRPVAASVLESTPMFLLTVALSHTSTQLLYPLFSAAPTSAISTPFHLLAAFVALTFYTLLPLPRILPWEVLWIALGLALITSEAVARIWGATFISAGLDSGVWLARLAVDGPATVLRWWCVIKGLSSARQGGTARLVSSLAIPAYLLSGWEPPYFYLIPECYILQIQGLVLILLATSTPLFNSSSPKAFNPRLRSLVLFVALLAAYLTSLTSNHCPTSVLRPTFLPSPNPPSSPILASKKSLTGWVVVAEHDSDGYLFRYLRADHSLLGGLWVGPAREEVIRRMQELKVNMWEKVDENAVVGTAESIYSTFIRQEIARFAGVPERQMARDEKALIIGLGAGLAARAFELHGVNTTIVEIDPVVYEYARKYFGVEEPSGGAVLYDARAFLREKSNVKYDYIIHDVFTGGTVPSLLFTTEFWHSVTTALSPTGVVAINFAGNITSRASHLVLSTILSSFPHVRAWEDGPPNGDFRNIVILCSASRPLRMRNPVPVDFLPYPSVMMRKNVFETYKDFEIDLRGTVRAEVLWDATAGVLDREQLSGAREHWRLMGNSLPPDVWASY